MTWFNRGDRVQVPGNREGTVVVSNLWLHQDIVVNVNGLRYTFANEVVEPLDNPEDS